RNSQRECTNVTEAPPDIRDPCILRQLALDTGQIAISFTKEAAVKRAIVVVVVLGFVAMVHAQREGGAGAGQGQAPGGGRGPSPEQQAALAKQDALEKATPQLQITEDVLSLAIPGHTIGEAVGVAKTSKGHLLVFTRSGNAGPARGATASQLFEFDQNLKFVKQWGPDNYAASFAHTVRVD